MPAAVKLTDLDHYEARVVSEAVLWSAFVQLSPFDRRSFESADRPAVMRQAADMAADLGRNVLLYATNPAGRTIMVGHVNRDGAFCCALRIPPEWATKEPAMTDTTTATDTLAAFDDAAPTAAEAHVDSVVADLPTEAAAIKASRAARKGKDRDLTPAERAGLDAASAAVRSAAAKRKTPQVAALPGMAPLGVAAPAKDPDPVDKLAKPGKGGKTSNPDPKPADPAPATDTDEMITFYKTDGTTVDLPRRKPFPKGVVAFPTREAAEAARIAAEQAAAARAAKESGAGAAAVGKRAAVVAAAAAGEAPVAPTFLPTERKVYTTWTEQVTAAFDKGDLKALKALEIPTYSSSPKRIAKYRDLCVTALEARKAQAKAAK